MRTVILAFLFTATGFSFPGYVTTLELRLRTPLTSFDTPLSDGKFEAVVIAPGMVGKEILMPLGTIVYGSILRRQSIGMGVVRERATLDLSFETYQLPDGRHFPMQGRLRVIENARESVDAHGRINGILDANTPQGMLGAIWRNPTGEIFQKSFLAIAGVNGHVTASYAMGPFGALALFAVRCTVFQMPEPEIRLPLGTEMKVAMTDVPADAPFFAAPASAELPRGVADWFHDQPFLVSKQNGKLAEDIINAGFIGTRQQLMAAFYSAGWVEADARTGHTVRHLWSSYAGQKGYPEAPASRLTYRDVEPDFVFQKSFNSITKRHHVRIWRVEDSGREMWLGAATHDIDISFQTRSMAFNHKIDHQIDKERSKIVTDFAYAGCADPWPAYVNRPSAMRTAGNGKSVTSDGRIAVMTLHDCTGESMRQQPLQPMPERSMVARIARRVILDARQYVLRDNPYYWSYRTYRFNHKGVQDPASVEY